jgi:hypothetical protein
VDRQKKKGCQLLFFSSSLSLSLSLSLSQSQITTLQQLQCKHSISNGNYCNSMAITTTTSSTLHTQFWAPKVNHPQSQTTTIYNPNSKPLIHHHISAMAPAMDTHLTTTTVSVPWLSQFQARTRHRFTSPPLVLMLYCPQWTTSSVPLKPSKPRRHRHKPRHPSRLHNTVVILIFTADNPLKHRY